MTMSDAINGYHTVADFLARSPHAARLLLDRGMHCVGCAIAPFETIAEACATYDVSVDRLVMDLTDTSEHRKDGHHMNAHAAPILDAETPDGIRSSLIQRIRGEYTNMPASR